LLRRRFVSEMFCYRRRSVAETFCYGDVLYGDVLSRRRFVRRRFVYKNRLNKKNTDCLGLGSTELVLKNSNPDPQPWYSHLKNSHI
jgi:hypothetical protein